MLTNFHSYTNFYLLVCDTIITRENKYIKKKKLAKRITFVTGQRIYYHGKIYQVVEDHMQWVFLFLILTGTMKLKG